MNDHAGKIVSRIIATQPSPHAPEESGEEIAPRLIASIAAAGAPGWAAEVIAARDIKGRATYGTPLCAANGRDWLADLGQEMADAAMYAEQGVAEGSQAAARIRSAIFDALKVINEEVAAGAV